MSTILNKQYNKQYSDDLYFTFNYDTEYMKVYKHNTLYINLGNYHSTHHVNAGNNKLITKNIHGCKLTTTCWEISSYFGKIKNKEGIYLCGLQYHEFGFCDILDMLIQLKHDKNTNIDIKINFGIGKLTYYEKFIGSYTFNYIMSILLNNYDNLFDKIYVTLSYYLDYDEIHKLNGKTHKIDYSNCEFINNNGEITIVRMYVTAKSNYINKLFDFICKSRKFINNNTILQLNSFQNLVLIHNAISINEIIKYDNIITQSKYNIDKNELTNVNVNFNDNYRINNNDINIQQYYNLIKSAYCQYLVRNSIIIKNGGNIKRFKNLEKITVEINCNINDYIIKSNLLCFKKLKQIKFYNDSKIMGNRNSGDNKIHLKINKLFRFMLKQKEKFDKTINNLTFIKDKYFITTLTNIKNHKKFVQFFKINLIKIVFNLKNNGLSNDLIFIYLFYYMDIISNFTI